MEASAQVTRADRGEDVEAGDPESELQHESASLSSASASRSRADKAVSTGDLGLGLTALGAPFGDLLAALVETKACAIKAECERVNRRTSRAWRLLRLHRKEPQAQARVTPVVHHHHGHHHHHPLHHHHHHHHHNHHQHPPITLHGSALSPTDGLGLGACSPLGPGPGPLSPPGGPTSACSSDLVACTLPAPPDVTVSGMCTTSDAPGLPSDTTLSPPHPDADSDSDQQHTLPPLPLDPPPSRPLRRPRPRGAATPLRRTLSSRSHQYHNYDYSTAHVTSWSCSATPQGTPQGTPLGTPVAGTPLATPAGSAAPSRAPSPPTPPDPENHLHLLYHPRPADPPPDPPPGLDRPRPRRKKRRRRKAAGAGGGPPGAGGARRGGGGGGGAKGAKQHGGGGAKGGKRPPIRGPLAQDVLPRQLDPDELPKRARWTIAVTAGFLLILSMLLVGITLRMAPLIDEMVRQQNEEHRNMLNSSHALPAQNSSHRS